CLEGGVQRLGGGKGGGFGKVLALAGAQEELPLGQGGDGGAVQQARGQGGKGIVAQGQVVLGAAQPAGHVVPAGQADGPAEQLGAAQAAVDRLIGPQVGPHGPQDGPGFFGLGGLVRSLGGRGGVQGQDAGDQLAGDVAEILLLHFG